MSILAQPPTTVITPAQRIAAEIRADAYREFNRLKAVHRTGLEKFWKNEKASPQEIAAALGTDAVEVFTLHGTIANILRQVHPSVEIPTVADYGSYTANQDGSITIE